MPLTKLDPVAALIVIDLQKGIVGRPIAHPSEEIVARAAVLARAFRRRALPVVLVHVTGVAPGRTDAGRRDFSSLPPDWIELVPELEPSETDIVIAKQRFGAFIGTSLHETLRARGVTQLFVTGIATSAGVESTLRSAYDLGYNAVAVVDAMTDMDPDAHRACVEKIFPRLSETTTTRDATSLLES